MSFIADFSAIGVAIFAVGLLFGKMFNKKPEKYSNDSYHGLPSTVKEFADSPKQLPPVPENKGVSTHDDWCAASNC